MKSPKFADDTELSQVDQHWSSGKELCFLRSLHGQKG